MVYKPKINEKSKKIIEKKRSTSPYKYSKELNVIINDPQRHYNIIERFQENEDLKSIVNQLLFDKVQQKQAPFMPQIYSK